MEPLRIAVIGVGMMGRLHLRVATESEGTRVVAVVDANPDAERLAWLAHADWLQTIEELGDVALDAAIVAVPTADHARLATLLLERGVPVLVEKPIAVSVEEAQALIDTAARTGVPLAVAHVERFNPAVQALQEKLREGALGQVFQVRAQRLSPFPVRVGDSGVALDLATHDLDLMCELAGTPLRVSAETARRAHRSHEDLVAATLRFDSGAIGLLEVNWLTPTKVRRLTVTGERGMFEVDYLQQRLTLYENAREYESWNTLDIFDGVSEGDVTRFAIARVEPLRAQLEAFVAGVRGEATIAMGGAEGLRALRLALAVVRAGEQGGTLELESAGL
jgi:UDP-N-acetylglucosamine 3-dehydrogenase